MRLLGSPGFGPDERQVIANALEIVADNLEVDARDSSVPVVVEEFVAWLEEVPRALDELRGAPPHSPLSALGEVYRRYAVEHDPGGPLGRLRAAIEEVIGKPRPGWFMRQGNIHVALARNVAGAWPVSLLREGSSTLHHDALAHACAALLSEIGRPMTPGELARALLDHYPGTYEMDDPTLTESATTDKEIHRAPESDVWAKQHAAQLLCRFTHDELTLIAARLRDESSALTAKRLAWSPARVALEGQLAWDRLEQYLGILEQNTSHSAAQLVRLVEEVLLEMDI